MKKVTLQLKYVKKTLQIEKEKFIGGNKYLLSSPPKIEALSNLINATKKKNSSNIDLIMMDIKITRYYKF